MNTTVTERTTKRADELEPGDWVTGLTESLGHGRAEILTAYPYRDDAGSDRVLFTFLEPGYPSPQVARRLADTRVEVLTAEQITQAREMAKREQKLADIEAWVAFMYAHPDAPMPTYPRFQVDLHDPDGIALVRRWAAERGQKVDESLDDRTGAGIRFGTFEWDLIAWHRDGRPVEPQPDDPTGLGYSRETDDPTPVSPGRVPGHVGWVDESTGLVSGGLVTNDTPCDAL